MNFSKLEKSFKNFNLKKFIKSHKVEILLALSIVIYIGYFSTASFLRYDNFYTGRYDLGDMDQVVWNTSRGRIFETSVDNGTIASRLSAHADFILILIAPLYKIWADPRLLLALQTIVLALGAIFVYKIALLILGKKNVALMFSIIYLLNPALQFTNLYDFHAVTFGTTFLLAAFYFFLEKKKALFILLAILAGITKEEVWVITGLFGAYDFVYESIKILKGKVKFKKSIPELLFGFAVFALSFATFFYLVSVAIPNARGGQHFALSYYSDFGDSPSGVIKNVIFSPGTVLQKITTNGSLTYLLQLFSPLGFLSFLSPIALIFALPDLAIDTLSSDGNLHQIFYQYSATITPFIFISAIFAVKNITKWFPKIEINKIMIFLLGSTLITAYLFGPLPGAKQPSIDMFTKQLSDKKLIQAFISGIPTKYSVAATNNLGSHLSRRKNVSTIPVDVDSADIVTFLLNDSFAQPSLSAQRQMVEDLKKNKNYQLLFNQGDFFVFQKKSLNYRSSALR